MSVTDSSVGWWGVQGGSGSSWLARTVVSLGWGHHTPGDTGHTAGYGVWFLGVWLLRAPRDTTMELLLASLLSPLFPLPFLSQATSISSLCLLFSSQLCEPLWVSQAVESTWGTDYWLDWSPRFDSHSSPPGHLYLPPPSSLLYVTLWTSLGVPWCGELFHH